nr:RecName: Full=55 kDa cell wall protein [Arabidopsis thaliana]
EATVDMPLD